MMKYKANRLFTGVAFTAATLVSTLLPVNFAAAANVSMSLSASKTTVNVGESFTVDVRLNTGTAEIVGALADVQFDAGKLQYVSISYSPSAAWGATGATTTGADFKRVDVYWNPLASSNAPAGNLTLARLTFKALAAQGSSSLSLTNAEVGSTDNDNPYHTVSTSGLTINFTSPPTPAPSNNQSSGGSSSGSSNNSSSTPTSTNPAVPTQQEADANAEVDDSEPVPIAAENVNDPAMYNIEVRVVDENGQPLEGETVELGEQKSTTDEQGVATFTGVSQGEYILKAAGTEQTVRITAGDPAVVQELEITGKAGSGSALMWILGGLVIVILAGAGVFIYLNRRKGSTPGSSAPATPKTDNGPDTAATPPVIQPGEASGGMTDAQREALLRPNPPQAETVFKPKQDE